MLKIAINGASGRMGQEILKIIVNETDHYQLGFAKTKTAYNDSLATYISQFPQAKTTEVVVDFSNPISCLQAMDWCLKYNVPLVVGTTGFTEEQILQIKTASRTIPILFSANMNLSVNVLFKVSELVAKALRNSEVEIIESHHRFKKDAPSGTALRLGECIAKARDLDFATVAKFDRTGNDNAVRNADEIGFAVVRGGDIVGKHTAIFINDGEELHLTSEITNRRSFAQGALLAARYIMTKKPGFYTMEDALGLSNTSYK